jgi:hypothetical protein
MEAVVIILSFIGALLGAFFGTLLARTERRIPVITHVKEIVQGEGAQETRERRKLDEWLYGAPKGGGG